MSANNYLVWILPLTLVQIVCAGYRVEVTTSSPVISGGVIEFQAELFDGTQKAEGSFLFKWDDNSLARHHGELKSTNPVINWSVTYPSTDCPPGVYVMQVDVYKYYLLIPIEVTSSRIYFALTNTLNGELSLTQQNNTIQNQFVSNETTVLHEVKLKDSDYAYLNKTASEILTYWFVDCDYYGVTNSLQFLMNYTTINEEHRVEAIVMPNFEPFPTEPPTTTSTTTPATTTTTTTGTTTTTKPKSAQRRKRSAEVITNFDPRKVNDIVHNKISTVNGNLTYNGSFPFICKNRTIVPVSSSTPYGYFHRNIVVKEPVKHISVSGNNWIQRSEVLDLLVTCNGSSSFRYCYMFKNGMYNVTGNETCGPHNEYETDKCEFSIMRYFYDDNMRTVVIIVANEVSHEVYPVTVTIYKVNKQAQLSVVVVPVGFSLVAVVLIIFGVAYYVQNRSRYIVEVADFDFGQQGGDPEYKTFTERLRDSFTNAFTRAPIPSSNSSEGAPVWHTSGNGNKYDSIS